MHCTVVISHKFGVLWVHLKVKTRYSRVYISFTHSLLYKLLVTRFGHFYLDLDLHLFMGQFAVIFWVLAFFLCFFDRSNMTLVQFFNIFEYFFACELSRWGRLDRLGADCLVEEMFHYFTQIKIWRVDKSWPLHLMLIQAKDFSHSLIAASSSLYIR